LTKLACLNVFFVQLADVQTLETTDISCAICSTDGPSGLSPDPADLHSRLLLFAIALFVVALVICPFPSGERVL
jgi:hypothetical protein